LPFFQNVVQSFAGTSIGADDEQLEAVRVGGATEHLERRDDEVGVPLGTHAHDLGRLREPHEADVVLGDRRQRATRGRVRHALALHLHEVDHDGDRCRSRRCGRPEAVVQHPATRRERRDRIERLDGLGERRVDVEQATLHHGLVELRHMLAQALLERLGDRLAERLGGRLALRRDRHGDGLAQRLERLTGMTGRGQPVRGDRRDARGLLERTLAGERRDRGRDVDQALPVLRGGELLGGTLEFREQPVLGEARRQLAEQRATIVIAARGTEPVGQRLGEVEIVGNDRPGARQRVEALRILAEPLVRLHEQMRGGARAHERERAFRDGGQRLPLLRGGELLAERQQRLLRTLDLGVQGAHGREQVVTRSTGPADRSA
jgi:hypothetical protein